MGRAIDADALIDKYGDWYTEEGTEEGYIGTIKGIVDSMPTIEPEIIRCKDCKYYIPYEWMFDGLTRSSNRNDYSPDEIGCSVNDHNYPPDGFCSFGERRGDGV